MVLINGIGSVALVRRYNDILKGAGPVYQRTFVDAYAKVMFAKLYSTKMPITSAELLNDRVAAVLRGARFAAAAHSNRSRYGNCGKADRHEYQLYLATNDIEHS